MQTQDEFYLLSYYVPKESLDLVNDALFSVGAGKLGNYEKCCWHTEGIGQFLPLSGSNPSIGVLGKIEKVAEIKCEMIILKKSLEVVIKTLIKAHPYETPAFHLSPILIPVETS